MLLNNPTKLATLAGLVAQCHAMPQSPEATCEQVTRDVAVLGGGSSGTYTAIRLKDSGKSVVVIEAREELGGHTETYTDPESGVNDDIGVISFQNISVVQEYFARLDIPLTANSYGGDTLNTFYVDFNEQKFLEPYEFPDPSQGIAAYAEQLAKYPELIDGFDALPDPVPEDLLLPFGDFAIKYGIESALPTLALNGQGGIDYINTPTIYIAKYLGSPFLHSLATGSLTTARHNNHEIYEVALEILGGDNVLLSSTLESSSRDDSGVKLRVRTSKGECVDISASKLVVAITPKVDSMQPLDLDATETDLFGRFTNVSYYTAVVRSDSIPPASPIFGIGIDSPYKLPKLPSPLTITPSAINGHFDVKYGGNPDGLSDDETQARVAEDLKFLSMSFAQVVEEPDFVVFKAHTPFQPMVSPEEIADGFYKKLWDLQGRRSTFYTGAAWQSQDSTMLWNFTEYRILPKLLE